MGQHTTNIWRTSITHYSRNKLLAMTFMVEGLVFVAALLTAGFFGIKLFPLTQNVYRDIVIGTFGALIPLFLFAILLSEKINNIPSLCSFKKTILNDIKPIFSETKLIDLCLISACAGLGEELLFRGVIQAKLGIVAASLIFGLLHFITPAYCVIATIMGFYLGFLFQYYDSILVVVQLHFVYDLGALILLRYYYFVRS